MPILRPCNRPGCGELVKSGRCEQHATQARRRYDARRGNFRERGYRYPWDKVSKQYRRSVGGLCEDCADRGETTPATLTHHLVPVPEGPLLDYENLLALCDGCHQQRHAEMG